METEDLKTPILNIAWTRYAHFDAMSNKRTKANDKLRKWIAGLGILATLFAILTQIYPQNFPAILGLVLKIFLIITPIASSILAAFTNKFFGGGDWLTMRAGAEQIYREIMTYRTILQKSPDRQRWLESRLTDIQRQVFRGLGGEMILDSYNGPIPPYDDPNDPYDDAGFDDLTGDEYFAYRVENQLAWHMKKLRQRQQERVRLQIYILLAGGAGAFLAAMGGALSLWVALTAAIAAALIGWQELRNLDAVIKNYSKVQLELMVIYDHWNNLAPEQRTDAEFYAMVRATEDLLWSQNSEYIKAMQEALAKSKEDDSLINDILQKSVEENERFQKSIKETVVEGTTKAMHEATDATIETFKQTFGSLAEEASSEMVQAELAAMQAAAADAVETILQGTSKFASRLQAVADEYKGVKINQETPASVLHGMIAKFPTTEDVKG